MNCTECQTPYEDIPVQNILGTQAAQNQASMLTPTQMPSQQQMMTPTQMPAQQQMPSFTMERLSALAKQIPGATTAPSTGPFGELTPITPMNQPPALTLDTTQYLNGALRTQIGQKVTVNFLLGTNTFQDRTGTLLAVGANYIIINEIETDDILFCDFYSIKFVRVYH